MTPEHERLFERVRQRREQHLADLTPSRPIGGARDANAGDRAAAGTRVFDPLTGEEGVIVGRTTANVVVSTPERADR